ncbi:MAG: hypothetical protein ABSG91_16435 [Syntrophobacteraceae bacterium]
MSVLEMKRLLINPICEQVTNIVDPLSHLQRQPAIFEGKKHLVTMPSNRDPRMPAFTLKHDHISAPPVPPWAGQ